MTEAEGWIWKHYTKENSDSVKCNHCGKVFFESFLSDRTQYLIFHLCDEHNITELDEHPERDNIQQNYEILKCKMMAICNHCGKGINYAIHGVHVLTIHLKIKHSNKGNLITVERSLKVKKSSKKRGIWDMFNEVDDNCMSCKGCEKIIKIDRFSTLNLNKHLHFCSNSSYKEKRRSGIYDKYNEVDENHMSCKNCKKKIKINIKNVSNLYGHLLRCRDDSNKLRVKQKKSRVLDMYDEVADYLMSCKRCKKIIKINKNSYTNLYQHLNFCPDNPNRLRNRDLKQRNLKVLDMYDKVADLLMRCKGCKIIIKINKSSCSTLYQHLRFCPNNSHKVEKKGRGGRKKENVWNMYDKVDDNHMSCKGCKKILKLNSLLPVLSLDHHLYFCPNSPKINRKSHKLKVKQSEKRKEVWDMYDKINDNYTSCKKCKKIIKINSKHPILNLSRHTRNCRFAKTCPKLIKDDDGKELQV